MSSRFHDIAAGGIRVALDLRVGHLRKVEIESDGRRLEPFYTAPWVNEPPIADDESIPAGLRYLSGDFFCAPFAAADVEPAPGHGWSANSEWTHIEAQPHPHGGTTARFELDKRILGARLFKEITLRDGHPFVYQRHVFEGGQGALPVASHAIVRFAARGRLSFSAKDYAETPQTPLEPDPSHGRSALAYPARFTDLTRAPLSDGRTTDIRSYPIAERHEDFVMLVEAPESLLGWASVVRPNPGDMVFSLKNVRDLPFTLLWFSNGGRDYPPWNGRNVGVLGIEEARSYSLHGHAASVAPNPLAESGVPTALSLDGGAEVRHVIGAAALPAGWSEVASVAVAGEALVVDDASGKHKRLPFDPDFLLNGR